MPVCNLINLRDDLCEDSYAMVRTPFSLTVLRYFIRFPVAFLLAAEAYPAYVASETTEKQTNFIISAQILLSRLFGYFLL